MPAVDGLITDALLTGVTTAFADYPVPFAIAVLLAVAGIIRRGKGRNAPKDPSRLFSANQRREGFDRAGGRCELESVPFIRCRRKATHGDHHYPHSKGGSTSMANFVAACGPCNMSKGSKIPGFLATQRMEARRRRYFPNGLNVAAGEVFAQR